jgi:hypothetical protein
MRALSYFVIPWNVLFAFVSGTASSRSNCARRHGSQPRRVPGQRHLTREATSAVAGASTWNVMTPVVRQSCSKPATAVRLEFGVRISTSQGRREQWFSLAWPPIPAFASTIDQEP